MLMTRNVQPSWWDAVLPEVRRRLPARYDLARTRINGLAGARDGCRPGRTPSRFT